jgi:hypothetical protein
MASSLLMENDANEKLDPAYIRIQILLNDFINNSELDNSKKEQLENIVSLYISYYKTLSKKQLSKERNSQTFIRKISEAKTTSGLKKEFEKERELLIGKLNEAGTLIEKYVNKIKKNKEKAKQKQSILKQFVIDKDAEIMEQKEKMVHLEALNEEYLVQYQGVSKLSDSLQEQLTASEQKLEKLLNENNHIEATLNETKKNNESLMEQLSNEHTESHNLALQQNLKKHIEEKNTLQVQLNENKKTHEVILQQHLRKFNERKNILQTQLNESNGEKNVLKAQILELQSELSDEYIKKSNSKNSNIDNSNNNNKIIVSKIVKEKDNIVTAITTTTNSSNIKPVQHGPKKQRKILKKKSKANILKVTKQVQFLESSIEKSINNKIANGMNGLIGASPSFNNTDNSSDILNLDKTNNRNKRAEASRIRKTRRSSSIKRVYETSSVVVAVRIRPMSKLEIEKSVSNNSDAVVTTTNGTTLMLDVDWDYDDDDDRKKLKMGNNAGINKNYSNKEIRSYNFDATFGPNVGQEIVYLLTGKHVLDRFLSGFNGTIFAYGQTGSGKTYTMMGDPSNTTIGSGAETDGITPRLLRGIFDHLLQLDENNADNGEVQWTLSVTYIEIYMESIRDLLSKRSVNQNSGSNTNYFRMNKNNIVDIRERQDGSNTLKGAMEVSVRSYEHLMACINEGTQKRSTERTNANETSSRSHSVLTLKLKIVEGSENEGSLRSSHRSSGDRNITSSSGTVVSKLHVVDLAGSENADATDGVSRQRRQEGLHINKSLLSLHRVIRTLTKEKESNSNSATFIPYRASKLTRLLKDSLGGNCFTLMICNLSPSSLCFGETKRSIQFAQSVKNVKNKAVKNIDPRTGRIRQLEAENKKLRLLVAEYKRLMMETIVGEEEDDDDDDDGYGRDDDSSLMSESTTESGI